MDTLLASISHWLPLIQGFAALASIAGALLSWKYALKAQRAREEMTHNIVSSRLVERFDETLTDLRKFRATAVDADGKPDYAKYQHAEQSNKQLLEDTAAAARAASPYLLRKPDNWGETLEFLANASLSPKPNQLELASKYLALVTEQLRMAASAREIGPSHEYIG